jgi:TPR repeat protein
MKSHFGICLGATFLTLMLAACDSRTKINNESQKSEKPSQTVETVVPEEDEFTKLRKLAEQGNRYAQFELGECFSDGNGVIQNEVKAAKWFRKAAEQGVASAQFNLGNCYASGKGVTKDATEAVQWYRKAAEQGNASAQFILGTCYDCGAVRCARILDQKTPESTHDSQQTKKAIHPRVQGPGH